MALLSPQASEAKRLVAVACMVTDLARKAATWVDAGAKRCARCRYCGVKNPEVLRGGAEHNARCLQWRARQERFLALKTVLAACPETVLAIERVAELIQ